MIDPCLIPIADFNNTLNESSSLMTYRHIFECQSLAENSHRPKWYSGNFTGDCIRIFKWVNVTQHQGKCVSYKSQLDYIWYRL